MQTQYIDMPAKAPSGGIDSYSSRSKILEGYVEDAINMDVDAAGKWSKRPGYENYYGWLPLRVRRFVQSGTTVKLYFDTSQSIDLNTTGLGPLVVYGKLPQLASYGTSSFSDIVNGKYFTSYTLESRETLSGTGTLTRAAADTGLTSKYMFVGLSRSDSSANASNTTLVPASVSINTSTFDVDVGYSFATSEDVYFLYVDKTPVAGSVYAATIQSTHANLTASDSSGDLLLTSAAHGLSNGDLVKLYSTATLPGGVTAGQAYYVVQKTTDTFKLSTTAGGSALAYSSAGTGTISFRRQGETFTIAAGTHNLNNFKIGVRVFDEASGSAVEVVPEQLTLSLTGTVTFTITDDMLGYALLTTVPLTNTFSAAAVAGDNTLSLSGPPSPYCFYYIYAYDAGLGTFVQVTPAAISYDETTDTTNISYYLATSSENVEVYYEETITISNILSVTDSGSATIDASNPNITVWGIGHENIYRPEAPQGGWICHVDNYKSTAEEKLVAGVGGILYSATDVDSAPTAALIPERYADLRARTGAETYIAPLFSTTSTLRSRGSVYDTSIEDNMALVTAATFVSEGVVDYTLSFTSKTGSVSTSSTIATSDFLTVSGMGDDRNNGRFAILSVQSDSATETVIRVTNEDAYDDTIDEADVEGRAGVFTDIMVFSAAHKFIAGDVITSESTTASFEVTSIYSSTQVVVEVEELQALPEQVLMFATRTSRVVPIRTSGGTSDVSNYVRGDSLSCDYVVNKPLVVNVNVQEDKAVTIAAAGGEATITFLADHTLNTGGYLFIFGDTTNTFNGQYVILDAPTTDTVTVAFEGTASGSAKVLGNCIELDENLEWYDANSVGTIGVVGRWLPIEAPDRNDSLVVSDTAYQHFDSNPYAAQPNVASVIVADTLLASNGSDEVYKYDGVSIYKAGLARTIPSIFMSLDTTVPSILKGFEVPYTAVSVAGKYFTVASDAFSVGDRVYDGTTEAIYTVVEKRLVPGSPDTWNIVVSGDTSGLTGTGTLTKVRRFRYYLRFNMIDINNNVVASNAANSSDMYFDLVASGRIRIKASYYLAQGFQDYSRIEAELYRTFSDEPAPFYLTKRIAVPFDYSGRVSIDFIDDNDDSFLTELDAVNSALLGTEIGSGWQPPYRAKHITTIDNRLLVANLKGWPKFDITFKPKGSLLLSDDFENLELLFKKDSADSSSTPNFEDRIGFEFVQANTDLISQATTFTFVAADVNVGTSTITEVAHNMLTGDAIKLTGSDVPEPLVAGTVYYVIKLTADTFQLASTSANAFAGTEILLTDAGSSTTTLTSAGGIYNDIVTCASHGFSTGDWVYLFYFSPGVDYDFTYSGWFEIEVLTTNTFQLLGWGRNTQTFGNKVPDAVVKGPNGNIPVWVREDYNYNQVNGNITGSLELTTARRLADAINFVMSYSKYLEKETYPDFQPWLTAYAGADYAVGQCIVEVQQPQETTPEVVLGTIDDRLSIFVNGLIRETDEQVSALTYLYPSRVGVSFRNYPEIFDRLDETKLTSASTVDINPADGQEITKIVPFFGESTFGGAQLNQVILVFKTNSIYVLDALTREYQKLDSRGVGCTAPWTVTTCKDGVMFVNRGGIYQVTRSFVVKYVGRLMEGKWKSLVNKDELELAAATHWGLKRKYKVSLPLTSESENSQVFAYNYDREEEGLPGAWTRYDNFNATLYTNQREANFFGSTEGSVYQIRQYDAAVDYRDGTSAISATLLFRAEDFGIPGVRKTVPAVVLQLDGEVDVTDIAVLSAINMGTSYSNIGTINIDAAQSATVKCSVDNKKGTHLQVKVTHSVIDEGLAITGVNYTVGRLDVRGVPQAADYRT